jgi:hypothetical protein
MLAGIVSFFNSEEMTVGAIAGTEADRRNYAAASVAFNLKDKTFVKLFGTNCAAHFPVPPPASLAPAAAQPSYSPSTGVADEISSPTTSEATSPTLSAGLASLGLEDSASTSVPHADNGGSSVAAPATSAKA